MKTNAEKTYIYLSRAGKFRDAVKTFNRFNGFRDYSKIIFRDENDLDRDVYILENIPGAAATFGTHATTATKLLNGATIDDAKPRRKRDGENSDARFNSAYKIAVNGDALLLSDATATAKIDRDAKIAIIIDAKTATARNYNGAQLTRRAIILAGDFIVKRDDDAINYYIPKTATARVGRFSTAIALNASIADAKSAIARVIAVDENATADDYASIADVKIVRDDARDFIVWRDGENATV